MTKYIAKQSIGQAKAGDIVTNLTPERAAFLASKGALEIVEDKPDDISDLTVVELKALLDERGIEYDSHDKKADLIALAGE